MAWVLSALNAILVAIAAVFLFALMMVTVVDVGGRFLFNSPLLGSYELSEICIGIVVSAALPIITLQNAHVRINLADGLLAGVYGGIRDCAAAVLLAVACAVLAWRIWLEARSAAELGAATDTLHLPKAPVIGFIALMFLLTGVVAIVCFLQRRGQIAGRTALEHDRVTGAGDHG